MFLENIVCIEKINLNMFFNRNIEHYGNQIYFVDANKKHFFYPGYIVLSDLMHFLVTSYRKQMSSI